MTQPLVSSPAEHPRARAAAALRRLGHTLMSHDADVEATKRRMFEVEVADGERVVHVDECFVSGPFNPLGGIVAAVFDDVLGYLLTLQHTPAFTGELTVRYLAPTPSATFVAVGLSRFQR